MEYLCQSFVSQELVLRQPRLGNTGSRAGLSLAQNAGYTGQPWIVGSGLLIVVHHRSALLCTHPMLGPPLIGSLVNSDACRLLVRTAASANSPWV